MTETKQKDKNFIVRKSIKHNGKPKISKMFEDLVDDAFGGVYNINNLHEFNDKVGHVVYDMIMYMVDERDDLNIENYKVVCNENNNPSPKSLPVIMDIHYRHKDSVTATIIHYVIDAPPIEEEIDRFAPWKV